MHGHTYRRWTYAVVQEEISYEHKPSEAWFLSYDLLTIKENVHLESPCSHCSRQASGTLLPSNPADWAVDREFLRHFQSCWKMLNCRLGFMYGSCMMMLHHISSCSSGIFEQRVSETVDRRGGPTTWRAGSPDLSALDFCLWGYLYSIVYATDVSVIQKQKQSGFKVVHMTPRITVQTWNVELKMGALDISSHRHEAVTWKPCFWRPVSIIKFFIVLWRRFAFCSWDFLTFCRLGYAFFVHHTCLYTLLCYIQVYL